MKYYTKCIYTTRDLDFFQAKNPKGLAGPKKGSETNSNFLVAYFVAQNSSVVMSDIKIVAERFFSRIDKLQRNFTENKTSIWGGSDAICIPMGASDDEVMYSKGASVHLFLLGYEFPDSIIVLTKGHFYFMATSKKCQMIQRDLMPHSASSTIQLHFLEKSKDDGQNRENFHELLNAVRKGNGKKIGCLFKEKSAGSFIPQWMDMIDQSQLEKFEINSSLGLFLAIKEEAEVEFCKRAAILTNKVMKHAFVNEMEDILDKGTKVSHEKLSSSVDAVILDAPNKLQLKIAADAVDSCYSPIIQSGGKYDIKVSGQSSAGNLSGDVIICSLGARYKGYCANVSRTYMVDVPPKVEKTYTTLVALFNACLEKMVVGNDLKDVYNHAKTFLTAKNASLVQYLPKILGFSIGLEFRDSTLLLNEKSETKFVDGMIFNLSVGFQNVPLNTEDKKEAQGNSAKLDTFSLLIADTVRVQAKDAPEVLTKLSKEFSDVSYNIADKDDNEEDEDEDEAEEGSQVEGDAAGDNQVRRSGRKAEIKAAAESAAAQRQAKQAELMKKKIEVQIRRLEAGGKDEAKEEEEAQINELKVYNSTGEYPRDTTPTQLRVDLEKECLLVPLNGHPVPFHISTIKNVSMPEPDRATYLRINFYIPGSALGKEANKNMAGLVLKHGDQRTFIKELTFRSQTQRNLAQVFQQFSELRKRVRQRELKFEQEKDLVVQQKLIRIKDQRIPRLQDLTMRPSISGRKCVGTIEAHQNGIRFTSTKYEVLDVLYSNVKHAIYQPCDPTTAMVLIHFHLKDYIMIGKKKQRDVQFFTEVVDSSLSLEGSKRSSYDPDELDEEQREREMRRRLNMAFKEFCQKLEKVAAHYDFSLQIDVPFRKSGFEANVQREMVLIQPTTHALVNLTETPPFVVTISDIEHVHFERAGFTTKAFDIVIIFKDWTITPKHLTGKISFNKSYRLSFIKYQFMH